MVVGTAIDGASMLAGPNSSRAVFRASAANATTMRRRTAPNANDKFASVSDLAMESSLANIHFRPVSDEQQRAGQPGDRGIEV